MQTEKHPESPCIGVCEVDRGLGLCLGCMRTQEELSDWRNYSAAQKQAIIDRIEAKKNRRRKS